VDLPALDQHRLRRLIAVGRSLVSRLDLDDVLDLVLDAARELTGARYAALGILDKPKRGLERFVTLGVDPETRTAIGDPPRGLGVLGELIRDAKPLRLSDVSAHPISHGFPPGHPPMRTFLGVPILIRGEPWGNLYLTEKEGGADFEEDDETAVVVLADWAAIAIENARSVQADRLRHSLEAAEQERKRWARELHDEILQALGGLRMLHSAALRADAGRDELRGALEEAIGLIDSEIDSLSALIAELRPAALDEIGLAPALRTLAQRKSREGGLEIDVLVRLRDGDRERLPHEIESTLYRLVQEALNNVAKHAAASRAEAVVEWSGDVVRLTVRDDGRGFDPAAANGGFGLTGMRERVMLAGGELKIDAAPGRGTTVSATIPLRPGGEPDQRSSRPRSST
jgi:signal transduction histidine kinase